MSQTPQRPPYRNSLAGSLLAAREAVMAPIRPVLRASGLTDQQWRVLRVLVDDGENDASGIARAGQLHAPSVTRILKELTDRGLISRTRDALDGRRSVVEISSQGRALVEDTAIKTAVLLAEYTKRFGAERLASLRAELAAFAAALGGMADPAESEAAD